MNYKYPNVVYEIAADRQKIIFHVYVTKYTRRIVTMDNRPLAEDFVEEIAKAIHIKVQTNDCIRPRQDASNQSNATPV